MKILIADDHDLVREGLKFVLKKFDQDIDLIEAKSFDEAARAAESSFMLDLVLLDLKMPGAKPMEGLAEIRKRAGDTPVVIISGAYSQPDITRAFQCGAAGFIPKTLGSHAMLSAINLVLSGERYVPYIAFANDKLQPETDSAPAEQMKAVNPFASLTPREHDVLELLVGGMSNREIAEKLQLQEVSIRARLTGVFRKLAVTNRTQAVGLAIRNGYPC